MSDRPVKPETHGAIDYGFLAASSGASPRSAYTVRQALECPLFVLLPWLTGALRGTRSRRYSLALGALLVAVYNLTDRDAPPKG